MSCSLGRDSRSSVRPGDTIAYSTTLIEKVELRSRPQWGLIRSRNEGVNQRGETVLSFIGQALVQRRPAD